MSRRVNGGGWVTGRARPSPGGVAAVAAAVAVLAMSMSAASAAALAPVGSLRLEAEIGGMVFDAVAEGDRVYLAHHSRLVVLGAGAGAEDAPLGVGAGFGDRIDGLDVRDGIVVTSGPVLRVIDARDPARMQPVGQLPMTVHGGGKVAIVGDEAWLVHGVAGVQRISLADPEQPRVLGHWLPAVATSLRASRRVTAAARIGAGRAALLVDDLPSGERPFRAVLVIAEVAAGRSPRVLDELELPCCGLHLKVQAGHGFVAQQESGWIRGFEIDAAGRIEQASSWQLPERVLAMVVGEAALWARSDAHYFVIDTAVTGAMRGPFELGASFSPLAAVGGQLLSVSQGIGQGQGVEWMDRAGARAEGPRLELATYVEIEPSPDGLWTMDGAVHHVSRLVPGDGPTSWRQVSTDLLADGIRAEQRMSAEGRLLAVADWWDIQVARAEEGGGTRLVAELEAADGVNHYGVMLLGAAAERMAYRVTPSRAGSQHRVYVRPLTEGHASPLWSVESGSNGLPFAGAALSESVLWTLVPGTGFVLQLRGMQVGGPLDGQPVGDPVPFVARTGTPRLMGAREGLLWIRDGEALVLIDVSDPRRPREAATLDFAGIVTAAELHGDRLWIGHPRVSSPGTSQRSGGGLEVFDVGDARSPRLLASVELGEPPSDLVVDEGGAWVSASAVQRFVYAPAPTPTNTLVAPTASASPVPSGTATPLATATPRPMRYGIALPWLAAGAAP